MAKTDKSKSPDEQALDMAIRAVAVLAVAHAARGTQLASYPNQFLDTTEILARYIKTGKR